MARTRNIKPGFFTNDLLGEIHPLGRILFAGLWCQADRLGIVEYRPRRLKAEILPFDDADVSSLVAELEARGFVQRFQADGSEWLSITKFTAHQSPHPREPSLNLTIPLSQPGNYPARPTCGEGHELQALASAETSPGEHDGAPGRAPRQAELPTTSLLHFPSPLPLPSSVARPADAGLPQQVRWAAQGGWQGITSEDRSEWRSAFPAVDLDAELSAAGVWLKAHPDRAKRTNWRKFLSSWFRNSQDRGGTRKGAAPATTPLQTWSDEDLARLAATRQREAPRANP